MHKQYQLVLINKPAHNGVMTPAHHAHHGPARALRRIGHALKSRTTTLDRAEDARSKQIRTEQVQFVRSFRM